MRLRFTAGGGCDVIGDANAVLDDVIGTDDLLQMLKTIYDEIILLQRPYPVRTTQYMSCTFKPALYMVGYGI